MAYRVRYSAEEKAAKVEQARELRATGVSLLNIAKEIGVAYKTMEKWIGGLPGFESSGRGRKKTPKASLKKAVSTRGEELTATPKSGAASKLVALSERLAAIDAEIAALTAEKTSVREQMKQVYERLGKEIYGTKRK